MVQEFQACKVQVEPVLPYQVCKGLVLLAGTEQGLVCMGQGFFAGMVMVSEACMVQESQADMGLGFVVCNVLGCREHMVQQLVAGMEQVSQVCMVRL